VFKKLCECALCQSPALVDEFLCSSCERDFRASLEARHMPPVQMGSLKVYSASRYVGANKAFVRLLKSQPWNSPQPEFRERLGRLARHWRCELGDLAAQSIVPVPSRILRRRIESDMSRLWAFEVAKVLKVPCVYELLECTWSLSSLRPQKSLNRRERVALSQQGRFKLRSKSAHPCRVLLVDDVCATGSSLRACAELLRRAGFEVCGAFVFARALVDPVRGF
jgi:predicted amidophosphoribosyltransferase